MLTRSSLFMILLVAAIALPPGATGSLFSPALSGGAQDPPKVTVTASSPPGLRHPFMGKYTNSMHEDAYATDAILGPGPVGRNADWGYYTLNKRPGMCPIIVFDSKGRMITLKIRINDLELQLIDPQTMRQVAGIDLPELTFRQRRSKKRKFKRDPDSAFKNVVPGTYLFIDHRDQIVVPTIDDEIHIFAIAESPQGPQFRRVKQLPLRRDDRDRRHGIDKDDQIKSVMPDWQRENLYWFATGEGVVGLVNTQTGQVRSYQLQGPETIDNSFSVGPEGAYILSTHALYLFKVSPEGDPFPYKRGPYDRRYSIDNDEDEKPGQLSPGSGTTPTLFGARYVAIGDNAHNMNVVVYDRTDLREIGKIPAFTEGASACENSFIADGNSLIVCNTWGYVSPFNVQQVSERRVGLSRIDLDPRTGRLTRKWEQKRLIQSTTPKLSLANRIIYTYTYLPRPENYWAIVGFRFDDGSEAFRIKISEPDTRHAKFAKVPMALTRDKYNYDNFDNAQGPIYLSPGTWKQPTVFVSMIRGFIWVRDKPKPRRS